MVYNTMTVKEIHFIESGKYSFKQTVCSTLKGLGAEHYHIQKCISMKLCLNFVKSLFCQILELCSWNFRNMCVQAE